MAGASEFMAQSLQTTERTLERVVTMLDNLEQRMRRLETISPSGHQVEIQSKRIDEIDTELQEAKKPPYQLISLAMTAVIALGSVIAFGINSKIDNFAQMTLDLSQVMRTHMADGHPGSVLAQVKANKESIEVQINSNERQLDRIWEELQRMDERSERNFQALEERTKILYNQGKPY